MNNHNIQEIAALRGDILDLQLKFGREMRLHKLNFEEAKEMLNQIKELNSQLEALLGLNG